MSVRRTHRRSADMGDAPAIVRLWLLRLLVPLNAHKDVVRNHGFDDDGLARLVGLGHWTDVGIEEFKLRVVRAELRSLHQAAERELGNATVPPQLATNVARLADLVGLSETDKRILEFAIVLDSERLLDETADHLGRLSSQQVCKVLAVLLDLPLAGIRAALEGQGMLSRSGLLVLVRSGMGTLRAKLNLLSEQFSDNLTTSTADPISLLRDIVLPSAPGHLNLADFEHLRASLDLLQPYLRRALRDGRVGVNVLVHGSPGTGKNQLVKAVAAALGCQLYEVSSEDADGDAVGGAERLRAFRVAQSVLSKSGAMILFDEVQDVFESAGRQLFATNSAAQGKKAWLNRTLEANPVPAMWLTNSIADVDPAFIRRFDMVLEAPIPPRRQREKIVRESCGELLDARAQSRLADCELLAPAVVSRAASVVQFVRADLGPVSPGDAVQRLVHQTLRAQGHPGLSMLSDPHGLPETYDPAFIQADVNLGAVTQGLARAGAGRLCLYGPPGTGETAWARWLARQLDRPLFVQRASDLMSMWVGGNEKNIAAAFRSAEADGAILLIDEVDSFLQDRRGAESGWQVTLVNEMLTQMESFAGLLIASTNLMDGLDAAALRRFDLKVRFDYLRPGPAWALLARQVAAFGLAPAEPGLQARLSRLDRLTPGDFAAVARQHRFRPMASAADVVSAIEAEVSMKRQGAALPIGFV